VSKREAVAMNMISVEELEKIVDGVWMTVLELPVIASDIPSVDTMEYLTSSIRISGAWHGTIQLKATREFFTLAAAKVFMKDASEVNSQDHIDVATELTNILGGTVKTLLPEVCDLSLPALVKERPDEPVMLESDSSWVHFISDGHPLAVAIVEDSVGIHEAA